MSRIPQTTATITLNVVARDLASGVFRGIAAEAESSAQLMLRTGRELSLAFTFPVTLLAGTAIREATRFEEAIARVAVAASRGGDDLAALQGRFRELALEMTRTSIFSVEEVTQGMLELARAGVTTAEGLRAGLPAALNLAAAGELDVAEATTGLVNVLKQFGEGIDQATRVADALAKAAVVSTADVRDMIQAFQNVGPVARQFGLSVEETAIALSILADQGIRGATAGTGLKVALLRLVSPTKNVQQSLRRLGIQVADAQGKLRPFPDILRDLHRALFETTRRTVVLNSRFSVTPKQVARARTALRDQSLALQQLAHREQAYLKTATRTDAQWERQQAALIGVTRARERALRKLAEAQRVLDVYSGKLERTVTVTQKLTEAQRLQILGQIFGTRGIKVISALLSAGADAWEEYAQEIATAASAQAQAQAITETLGGQLRILRNQLQVLAIKTVLPFVSDVLRPLLKALNALLAHLDALPPRVTRFALGFGLAAAAVGPLLFGLGQLLIVAQRLGSPLGLAVSGLALLAGVVSATDRPFRRLGANLLRTVGLTGDVSVATEVYRAVLEETKDRVLAVGAALSTLGPVGTRLGVLFVAFRDQLQELLRNLRDAKRAIGAVWRTLFPRVRLPRLNLEPFLRPAERFLDFLERVNLALRRLFGRPPGGVAKLLDFQPRFVRRFERFRRGFQAEMQRFRIALAAGDVRSAVDALLRAFSLDPQRILPDARTFTRRAAERLREALLAAVRRAGQEVRRRLRRAGAGLQDLARVGRLALEGVLLGLRRIDFAGLGRGLEAALRRGIAWLGDRVGRLGRAFFQVLTSLVRELRDQIVRSEDFWEEAGRRLLLAVRALLPEDLRETFDQVVERIRGALFDAFRDLTGLRDLPLDLDELRGAVTRFVRELGDATARELSKDAGEIVADVLNVLSDIFDGVFAAVVRLTGAFIGAFGLVLTQAFLLPLRILGALLRGEGQRGVEREVSGFGARLGTLFQSFSRGFREHAKEDLFQRTRTALEDVYQQLLESFVQGVHDVERVLSDLFGRPIDFQIDLAPEARLDPEKARRLRRRLVFGPMWENLLQGVLKGFPTALLLTGVSVLLLRGFVGGFKAFLRAIPRVSLAALLTQALLRILSTSFLFSLQGLVLLIAALGLGKTVSDLLSDEFRGLKIRDSGLVQAVQEIADGLKRELRKLWQGVSETLRRPETGALAREAADLLLASILRGFAALLDLGAKALGALLAGAYEAGAALGAREGTRRSLPLTERALQELFETFRGLVRDVFGGLAASLRRDLPQARETEELVGAIFGAIVAALIRAGGKFVTTLTNLTAASILSAVRFALHGTAAELPRLDVGGFTSAFAAVVLRAVRDAAQEIRANADALREAFIDELLRIFGVDPEELELELRPTLRLDAEKAVRTLRDDTDVLEAKVHALMVAIADRLTASILRSFQPPLQALLELSLIPAKILGFFARIFEALEQIREHPLRALPIILATVNELREGMLSLGESVREFRLGLQGLGEVRFPETERALREFQAIFLRTQAELFRSLGAPDAAQLLEEQARSLLEEGLVQGSRAGAEAASQEGPQILEGWRRSFAEEEQEVRLPLIITPQVEAGRDGVRELFRELRGEEKFPELLFESGRFRAEGRKAGEAGAEGVAHAFQSKGQILRDGIAATVGFGLSQGAAQGIQQGLLNALRFFADLAEAFGNFTRDELPPEAEEGAQEAGSALMDGVVLGFDANLFRLKEALKNKLTPSADVVRTVNERAAPIGTSIVNGIKEGIRDSDFETWLRNYLSQVLQEAVSGIRPPEFQAPPPPPAPPPPGPPEEGGPPPNLPEGAFRQEAFRSGVALAEGVLAGVAAVDVETPLQRSMLSVVRGLEAAVAQIQPTIVVQVPPSETETAPVTLNLTLQVGTLIGDEAGIRELAARVQDMVERELRYGILR